MKKAKGTTNNGRGDNEGRGSALLTSLFSNVKGDISEHLREKERTNLSENLTLVLDSLSMLFYNAIDVICIRFTLIERPFMLLRNNFIYQLVNSLIKDVKSDDTVENNTSLQLLVDLACELNPSLREVKINNLKELLKAKAIQQQLLNSDGNKSFLETSSIQEVARKLCLPDDIVKEIVYTHKDMTFGEIFKLSDIQLLMLINGHRLFNGASRTVFENTISGYLAKILEAYEILSQKSKNERLIHSHSDYCVINEILPWISMWLRFHTQLVETVYKAIVQVKHKITLIMRSSDFDEKLKEAYLTVMSQYGNKFSSIKNFYDQTRLSCSGLIASNVLEKEIIERITKNSHRLDELHDLLKNIPYTLNVLDECFSAVTKQSTETGLKSKMLSNFVITVTTLLGGDKKYFSNLNKTFTQDVQDCIERLVSIKATPRTARGKTPREEDSGEVEKDEKRVQKKTL